MAMKYNIDFIHGATKVSDKFDRQITIYCDNWQETKDVTREMLAFFTKAHGVGYDSDTVSLVSVVSFTKEKVGFSDIVKFKWSYKLPKQSWHPITFYVKDEVLANFKFWFPKETYGRNS